MKKKWPRSSVQTTHCSKITHSNSLMYFSFTNQQEFLLQINSNFVLFMIVSLNSRILNFKGQICNVNKQPLKVPTKYWKIIESNQNILESSVMFSHSWHQQTIKCTAKVVTINENQHIFHKIFVKKLQQIKQKSQQIVKSLAKLGLLNNSAFNSLQTRKLTIKTKQKVKQALLKNKYDKDELELIIDKISDFQIDQKNYGNLIQDIKIEKLYQKGIKEQDLIMFQKERNDGQYNIEKNKKLKIVSGGYFDIQYHICKLQVQKKLINENQMEEEYQKDIKVKGLMSKKLRTNRKDQINVKKLEKQLFIIQKIQNKKHLINYYRNSERTQGQLQQKQQQKDWISQTFMDFYPHTVKEYLDRNKFMAIEDIIELSKQILQAIQNLHDSEIIHRDIKLSNFLIDFNSNPTKFNVKIIDFCQSSIHSQVNIQQNFQTIQKQRIYEEIFVKFDKKFYGYTLPYSPIQCVTMNNQRQSEGINSYKIDSWSIGIVLYLMMFKTLPISQSQHFKNDMVACFSTLFQFMPNQTSHCGLELFKSITKLIVKKNLKYKQNQRMNITQIRQIYQLGCDFFKQWVHRAWNQ